MAGRGMGSRRGGVKIGLVWDPLPPLSDHVRLFQLARLNGLDFVLLGDHVQGMFPRSIWDARLGSSVRKGTSPHECLEVFTLLGRLSGAAGRLQLGVGVADVLRRHPIVLAQAALTLAHLLPRPFILGLGAGERLGTEPYGLDPVPRASRLEEAARYVRTAFDSGASFDIDGSFYSAKGAIMDLRPPAGRRPQIWIAAHGPRSLATAGRVGDGWLPTNLKDPGEYERLLTMVRAAAQAAGRDPDSLLPALMLSLVVARTDRQAHKLLDSRLARFTAAIMVPAPQWRASGGTHPFGEGFGGYWDILPEELDPATVEEAIRTVPQEVLERHFLWGSPSRVQRELEDLRDAGMRAVCFIPGSFQTLGSLLYTLWSLGQIRRRLR